MHAVRDLSLTSRAHGDKKIGVGFWDVTDSTPLLKGANLFESGCTDVGGFHGGGIVTATIDTGYRCRFFDAKDCKGSVVGPVEGLEGGKGNSLVSGREGTVSMAMSATCWYAL
jgi:hypothetical protein